MPVNQGGFLILFDEIQRTSFLHEVDALEDGFSDALSRSDWSVKQWEVCGLMFEPMVITHWALARKGNKVVTGKVRVEFTEVTPTRILLGDIEQRVGPQIRRNIVSARSGVGGRVPPGTWQGMKSAVGEIDASSLVMLERLERLRDQSREFISRPGSDVVAQQRDAVGMALDAFDTTGNLRKRTLKGWVAPDGPGMTSFLDGLSGVRTIEDQLIARDAASFPGSEATRHTVVGAVFAVAGRKLEVFNVNRSAVETSLGVDLLYFNETFNAWTLIQYKSMESIETGGVRSVIYRPDTSFDRELVRMQAFRAEQPDTWQASEGRSGYRLCGDGFFFKLCSRVQLEVLSDKLLPGMYLPREFVEAVIVDPEARGPQDGRMITFTNTARHISNTQFSDLLRDGWVGTRGVSSDLIAKIVQERLTSGVSVVIARARPDNSEADPDETLSVLGI